MLFVLRQRIVNLGSLSFFFLFGFATKGYDNKTLIIPWFLFEFCRKSTKSMDVIADF